MVLLLWLLALVPSSASAQGVALGQWRHHLPNNRIIGIIETPDRIVGASNYGLVVFNKSDNSLERINKVHGLSDFGITALAYARDHKLIMIGYENGNLDMISNNSFVNLQDIRRSSILGSKRINRFLVDGEQAYLACDFGIVQLDLTTLLINDTYFIGSGGALVNVYDLALHNNRIYAATNQGLIAADANAPNLTDFNNWHKETVTGLPLESFNHLEVFQGQLFANLNASDADYLYYKDDIGWQLFNPGGNEYFERKYNIRSSNGNLLVSYPSKLDIFDQNLSLVRSIDNYYEGEVRAQDMLLSADQSLWIADFYYGMVRERSSGEFQRIVLPGPVSSNAFRLAYGGNNMWVAPGAISSGGFNTFNHDGVFVFGNERWRAFNRFAFPELTNVWDIIRIAVDPANPSRVYAGSWTSGLMAFSPDGLQTIYNESNSTLQARFEIEDQIRIGGIAFDQQGNVWVSNSEVQRPLSVRKANGEWLSFGTNSLVPANQLTGEIIIDQQNQKWMILPNGGGIYLFRENSLEVNNDFRARRLSTQQSQGNLPGNFVYALALDHNGYVWVGTDKGVAVFYTPQRAFTDEALLAQQIIVEQDGFGAILFEEETVNCITVDGSNKKWFGTSRSGAFLLSSDARQTIYHFNRENSPLPSNNVLDIAINNETGEVFFATDRGLVSFRGRSTAAADKHGDVYAYPNPVRPGFEGYIAVNGLVRNAYVKITDINGNLMYETVAEGGQAVWNGRDLNGRKPSSGVYLVFSTNADGSETMVTKILFLH